MHIHKGDAIKYGASLYRIAGKKYARLVKIEYGYAVEEEYNNLVHVDNGVRIQLVSTEDIIENYGQNVIFRHKNDIPEETNDDA